MSQDVQEEEEGEEEEEEDAYESDEEQMGEEGEQVREKQIILFLPDLQHPVQARVTHYFCTQYLDKKSQNSSRLADHIIKKMKAWRAA